MSKEDEATRIDAGCLTYGAFQGAPGGVIGDTTSSMSIGVAGVVMPGGLFSTTPVRPASGGQLVRQSSKLAAGVTRQLITIYFCYLDYS